MNQGRSTFSPMRTLILLLSITCAVVYWTGVSSSSLLPAALRDAMAPGDATSNLSLYVAQTKTSPPTISLAVTNKHSSVLTLLTWDGPLDPAAIQLGLVSITPEGASAPLDIPTVAFRRVMPPRPDDLVTLQPGESRTAELKFEEPVVSLKDLGKSATVRVKGSWSSVWPGYTADQLTPDVLDKLQYGENAESGLFDSGEIEVTIG